MAPTWLLRFAFFKLMLMSGVVKLSARCPTWEQLTALEYHFATQCIPTPLAWHAHQLPPALLRLGVGATLIIEIPLALLLIAPFRQLRRLGAAFQVLLQLLIMLTGNYTFFNALTLLLCVPVWEDDAYLGELEEAPAPSTGSSAGAGAKTPTMPPPSEGAAVAAAAAKGVARAPSPKGGAAGSKSSNVAVEGADGAACGGSDVFSWRALGRLGPVVWPSYALRRLETARFSGLALSALGWAAVAGAVRWYLDVAVPPEAWASGDLAGVVTKQKVLWAQLEEHVISAVPYVFLGYWLCLGIVSVKACMLTVSVLGRHLAKRAAAAAAAKSKATLLRRALWMLGGAALRSWLLLAFVLTAVLPSGAVLGAFPVTAIPLLSLSQRWRNQWVPQRFVKLFYALQPFHVSSGYGLFRRMTGMGEMPADAEVGPEALIGGLPPSVVARPEIILEGFVEDASKRKENEDGTTTLVGDWVEIPFA
mmetsp:Transcript_37611/g.117575  ORF Transcript_37611/g.117575 Transcript_37611/m.117575 type:complete len:477 (-) Transcript_37611:356-1786(-)